MDTVRNEGAVMTGSLNRLAASGPCHSGTGFGLCLEELTEVSTHNLLTQPRFLRATPHFLRNWIFPADGIDAADPA